MKKIIQFHIHKGDTHYVAETADLPVVTQAETLDELSRNIREAVSLQLESEDPASFGLASDYSVLADFELPTLVNA